MGDTRALCAARFASHPNAMQGSGRGLCDLHFHLPSMLLMGRVTLQGAAAAVLPLGSNLIKNN